MQCPWVPESIYPAVPRIIAIGDIHGDWEALQSSLRLAKVINKKGNWIGGNTYVVQVGDLLDKGCRAGYCVDENSEIRILKYLDQLHGQASKQGGAVLVLLGNHEVMNVVGDMRYASPAGIGHFGSEEERKQAFSPGNGLAQHLACKTNSIIKIGSWIFSHTGVLPEIAFQYSISDVNQLVREFLLGNVDRKDKRLKPILDTIHHREYGYPGKTQCPALGQALRKHGGKRMVIGHTVQDGINSDCGGQLWRVDIGMSGAFGPRDQRGLEVQVLEINNDGNDVKVLKYQN